MAYNMVRTCTGCDYINSYHHQATINCLQFRSKILAATHLKEPAKRKRMRHDHYHRAQQKQTSSSHNTFNAYITTGLRENRLEHNCD